MSSLRQLGPALAVALLAAGVARAAEPTKGHHPTVYTLAIIPQAPPVALSARWAPFADRLSALTGVTIRLKLYEDLAGFEREIAQGVPDFLFAHPYIAAAAHQQQGYLPLVRDRSPLAGLIFVRQDSPIQSLRDLAGKRIAYVGPRSFCSIMAREALSAVPGGIQFGAETAGSTRNVLKSVLLGKADAGASLDASIIGEAAELREGVRVVWKSAAVSPHPLSAHPRVPAALRAAVTTAVLRMAQAPADQAILSRINLTDPVPADYQRDYQAFERAP